MLTFIVILTVTLSVLVVAFNYRVVQNPRKEWERKHGGEVQGGEPTAEALARIQRNATLAMIFGPIGVTLVCVVGYLKLEQGEKADRARIEQQSKQVSPMFRQFGNLSKIRNGMTVAEVEAIMGPGHRRPQADDEHLSWAHREDGKTYQLYVETRDGKVVHSGRIGPFNGPGDFLPPPVIADQRADKNPAKGGDNKPGALPKNVGGTP